MIHYPQSRSAEAVIEACLGLARKLDMKVVAEGIESLEIALILTDMGCNRLQGHYFGAAMPPAIAAQWVKEAGPKAVACGR